MASIRLFFLSLLGIVLVSMALAWVGAALLPSATTLHRLVIRIKHEEGGVSLSELYGIRTVLGACVEDVTSVPVVDAERAADDAPGTTYLTLTARRFGDGLRLTGTLRWPGERAKPFDVHSPEPRKALRSLLEHLHLRGRGALKLLPRSPQYAWPIFSVYGYRPGLPMPESDAIYQQVAQVEPEAPLAWGALAIATHLVVVKEAGHEPLAADRCEGPFRQALALAPKTPLIASRYAIHRALHGEIASALETVLDASRRRPRSLSLLQAQSYVARQAGLLEGAGRAIAAWEKALGPLRSTTSYVENLWLYTGDWPRFEETLGTGDPGRNTYLSFYRGYIRLLRGQKEEAIPHFRVCVERGQGAEEFARLAKAYLLCLNGEVVQGRQALMALWDSRLHLHAADGEFTIKMAEALAYMGARDEAVSAAQRAFDQGFSCMPWYQNSPLLRSLHGDPKWQALNQALEARYAKLSARFPASRFGG